MQPPMKYGRCFSGMSCINCPFRHKGAAMPRPLCHLSHACPEGDRLRHKKLEGMPRLNRDRRLDIASLAEEVCCGLDEVRERSLHGKLSA